MSAALPLAEAQAELLKLAEPLPVEQVDTASALGRYLAAPLNARRTQPPADLSAMDGYALADAGRTSWRVIGESAAGHPFAGPLDPGEAVRISTGAVVPGGADAVFLQEDAARDGETLGIAGDPPRAGRHIRRAGFDFREGDRLLEAGARIGPAALALAISAGHASLPVRRRPEVAIIDSGDELASDPADCSPHQIPASNGPMLQAMLSALPCVTRRLGPIPDRRDALAQALDEAKTCDLIVTSGGASVGDHDLIRPALADWGAEIAFWRVAMKPGKPLLVARRGRQLVLGLPGNPVSSFVTGFLFLLPLARALLGAASPLPQSCHALLGASLPQGGKRLEFLRARWDGEHVVPLAEQDSSGLNALAESNALIERPAGAAALGAGAPVRIFPLQPAAVA
ncbi:MAG: molybdopterin molybdotransferase MoeA [Novosphingobium sp.]